MLNASISRKFCKKKKYFLREKKKRAGKICVFLTQPLKVLNSSLIFMTYELNEITVEITEIYSRAFMEKIRKIIKATIVL